MKDGIKYKGVITDPRDGETVAVEIATVRPGAHSAAHDAPGYQDAASSELVEELGETGDTAYDEPNVYTEDVAQPASEDPVVLSGRYAAMRDALRERGQQLAANIGPAAAAARPWLSERAKQLSAAAAIAAEEYQGGKPKPRRPKPRPKPHPRVAEFNDKYRRIRELFRPAAAPTTSQTRPRRSRNAGMKTNATRVPGIKVVTKR